MPNGQIVTIVDSGKAVKVGILLSALRKADLTPERFIELLKA
jgi:hypothetical protein